MAKLSDLPGTLWLGIAGVGAFVAAPFVPDDRAKLALRVGGLAGVAVAIALVGTDVLVLLGIKEPERIESIDDERIDAPAAGQSHEIHGDDGGLVGATIVSPSEGVDLERSGFIGGRYQVTLRLASSKRKNVRARVRLVSDERYSFGGSAQRVTDLGTLDIPPSSSRTVTANVDVADDGFVNPFSHPEVALTLELDGRAADVARFTYS